MTAIVGTSVWQTVRRAPRPGEIGCVGSCPLCAPSRGAPPCLACRDEMRARLGEMRLAEYVERAVN